MVHALRRAHGLVQPSGCLVDIHPTADLAVMLVGDTPVGVVESPAGAARHQAAADAIAAASDEGWFAVEGASEFDFYTYGDTVEELRDFILANWRDTALAEDTVARARSLLAPGVATRVRERVAICRLVPRAMRPPRSVRPR
ncbi:MAG: hypothetical protein OEW19_19585 [Acidobacteriota bacterium]|nr:hypothetical protein [Acidobacteriota bacterium]